MEKSIPEKICDHLQTILQAVEWESLTEPDIYQGLAIWDPETQGLPLITILPEIEKATEDRYGNVKCEMMIDIKALIPCDIGATAIHGLMVAHEIRLNVFESKKNNWESFPEELINLRYVEGGVTKYPDEMNPQLLQAGITISVLYEVDLYPPRDPKPVEDPDLEDPDPEDGEPDPEP